MYNYKRTGKVEIKELVIKVGELKLYTPKALSDMVLISHAFYLAA